MVQHARCSWLDVHRSDEPSGAPGEDHTGDVEKAGSQPESDSADR